MVLYEYNNILISIDLYLIHNAVINSTMTNKTIEWCRWDEKTGILKINFINTLSQDDKDKLDIIVSDNT